MSTFRKMHMTIGGAALLAGAAWLALAQPANASKFKVYSPIVEEGELELEFSARIAQDGDRTKDNEQRFKFGIGYGVTDIWFTEIEGFWRRNAGDGENVTYRATSWENVIQILPQGKHWVDLGLFAEYEAADRDGDPDKVEFGPLIQKSFGPVLATANIIFEKPVGTNADESTVLEYGFQAKWRWKRAFEPGIEAFGELGEIRNFTSPDRQDHRLGPAIFGKVDLIEGWGLKYEAAALFGLNDATPDVSYKGLIELEHHF